VVDQADHTRQLFSACYYLNFIISCHTVLIEIIIRRIFISEVRAVCMNKTPSRQSIGCFSNIVNLLYRPCYFITN